MPRARTGTWKRSGDQFLVYVTLPQALVPGRPDRRLPGIPVPLAINGRPTSEKELDKLAKLYTDRPELALSRLAEQGKLPEWVPPEAVPRDALLRGAAANPAAAAEAGSLLETTAHYAERWLAWRDRHEMTSITCYRSAVDQHILPVLGEKPVVAITTQDAREIARILREKSAAKVLSPASANKYWKVFRAMLRDASDPDLPELCVRESNPAAGVKGPPRPKDKTRGCFYPQEFLQFVTCESIPLRARRWVALMIYLCLRPGELQQLRCGDIDLRHKRVAICRSWDRAHKREKGPKNGKPRYLIIKDEDNVLPLLRVMIEERGGEGRLCPINAQAFSKNFRRYLDRAGLKRPELRERSATHIPLTTHGLRATGTTWRARRGDNPHELRRWVGHGRQETTDRYIDEAQLMGAGVDQVFPPLPACLLVNRSGNRSGGGQVGGKTGGELPPWGSRRKRVARAAHPRGSRRKRANVPALPSSAPLPRYGCTYTSVPAARFCAPCHSAGTCGSVNSNSHAASAGETFTQPLLRALPNSSCQYAPWIA
jgi:integrase